MRPRDALAWRLSPWLPDRDGERGNPDLPGPSEPAHAGGAEAQPSPRPPPLLPSPSPRLEPPHDAISGGWSRGGHVPSPAHGTSLRFPPCPPVASPHAAGHQAPHGLHASLAIRTRRSDAPWDGLPSPVFLVPVLGADEPTPRPAHIGTESLEAAATYFLRADGSFRSLDLAANYRVTVIRDRREATNREFMKIATHIDRRRCFIRRVRNPPNRNRTLLK